MNNQHPTTESEPEPEKETPEDRRHIAEQIWQEAVALLRAAQSRQNRKAA
jgi:hypothetical protein